MESIDFKRYRIFNDRNASIVHEKARETLINLLRERKDHPVLLLLSGGSAFDILKDMPNGCVGKTTTIGVLDERFSKDQEVNNFSLLEKTDFFQLAKSALAQSIDTRPHDNENLAGLALRFETALRTWHTAHPKGTVIITQGIGPDGHTAGIMPYPEDEKQFEALFLDDAHWVCGYNAGTKNQYPLRITVTIPFLRLVDHSIVYCVGQNKKEALGRVLDREGDLFETPARVIREMRDVKLFTDISLPFTLV